eukprot:SM000125S26091  [mRNA]  locus=s125:407805:408251:+ [translate_table: standard]
MAGWPSTGARRRWRASPRSATCTRRSTPPRGTTSPSARPTPSLPSARRASSRRCLTRSGHSAAAAETAVLEPLSAWHNYIDITCRESESPAGLHWSACISTSGLNCSRRDRQDRATGPLRRPCPLHCCQCFRDVAMAAACEAQIQIYF